MKTLKYIYLVGFTAWLWLIIAFALIKIGCELELIHLPNVLCWVEVFYYPTFMATVVTLPSACLFPLIEKIIKGSRNND